MKWHLLTAVILGLLLASAVSAAPSSGDKQRLKYVEPKWPAGANGDEKMYRGFQMNYIPSNPYSNQFLLKKMDGLYEEIAQEVAETEQRHEDYRVLLQESDLYSNDINKQLKGIMLNKLKQMYDQVMAQNNVHLAIDSKSGHDGDDTETGKLIDRFLHDKIHSMILKSRQDKQTASYDNLASAPSHEHQAHIMTDQSDYIPIYKFDGSASDYCYPDWPSAGNDNNCITSFDPNAPVFYQVSNCDGQTVYTYWLWYGLQKPCIFNQGTHGNDWEHVSVYVNPSDGLVSKVVYHQHGGHYTRRRDKYEREGERPIVYIGKIAHGSYHSYCSGHCSFSELINYGCFGLVRFCIGGCGYWDDFRNPGEELRDPTLYLHQEGQTIDGITRPDREICGLATCEGSDYRSLTESGCWQDKP